MLQREVDSSGIVYYFSPLLRSAGVAHAFSTRIGGCSPAPFASLNLGNPNGCEQQDDYQRIWENYRALGRASGCKIADQPIRVHQVHAATVLRVEKNEPFDCSQKADALVSDDPSRVLSVRVADCVPVLLASKAGDRVAAVHAGWRGVIAGVVPKAVRVLLADERADSLLAAIGPCIGFDAFEVGMEVVGEFERAFASHAPRRLTSDGKGRVDLRQAVRRQLIAAGLVSECIDTTDRCTHRDEQEFFSHRRDNGVTGRMAALIQSRVTCTQCSKS